MRSQLIRTFIFFSLFLPLIGCRLNNCAPQPDPVYNYFSPTQSNIIPYTGHDTLFFVNNLNDTAMMIGQGMTTSYDETKQSADPDCGTTDIQRYEMHYFKFLSNTSKLSDIEITYHLRTIQGSLLFIEVQFNGFKFYYAADQIDDRHVGNFADSVNVGNYYYYRTSEADKDGWDYNYQLFFNKSKGIVGYKYQNAYWRLLK